MKYLLAVTLFCASQYIAPLDGAFAEEVTKTNGESGALKKRIDFGDSYITGQSIKSGAVYLLQRKPSEIKSMLSYRETYRDEILEGFSVQERASKGSSGASLIDGLQERW